MCVRSPASKSGAPVSDHTWRKDDDIDAKGFELPAQPL